MLILSLNDRPVKYNEQQQMIIPMRIAAEEEIQERSKHNTIVSIQNVHVLSKLEPLILK